MEMHRRIERAQGQDNRRDKINRSSHDQSKHHDTSRHEHRHHHRKDLVNAHPDRVATPLTLHKEALGVALSGHDNYVRTWLAHTVDDSKLDLDARKQHTTTCKLPYSRFCNIHGKFLLMHLMGSIKSTR